MNTIGRRTMIGVLGTLSVTAGCAASASRPPVAVLPPEPTSTAPSLDLDGEWEGQLQGFHGPGLEASRTWDHKLRVTVRGAKADVEFWHDGTWRKQNGDFRVDKHDVSAVIYAMHSSHELGWVETWLFAVTEKTRDSLLVYWYRVVNNYRHAADKQDARFAFASTGELERKH